MFISMLQLGSLVLDIDGGRLDARFLRETGEVQDNFTILKILPAAITASGFQLTAVRLDGLRVSLTWETTPGKTYTVQRAVDLVSPVWQAVSGPLAARSSALTWSGPAGPGSSSAFYRVICEGN